MGVKQKLTQPNALLEHISAYWDELLIDQPNDKDTLIGLPHKYVVPSVESVKGFLFKEQYYWDTAFIVPGLIAEGRQDLAVGMVENLLSMFNRFGVIPNANRFYMLSRSQPPQLSSLVRSVYKATQDREWLKHAAATVEKEYHQVWLSAQHPHNRQVYRGLSRYYDINVLHELAEAESGWDYTPRFEDRCLDYLPIDLNSWLYKYETDLADIHKELNNHDFVDRWEEKAKHRKNTVDALMWEESDDFYYDFDYINERKSPVRSLAAYTPLFVGMSSTAQAEELHSRLKWFETPHGLATTSLTDGVHLGKQWAAPNGWAPLHYLVVYGLQRYGFDDAATRIAHKWVQTVNQKFEETGLLYETYNVVDPIQDSVHGVYPQQHGFAWTNAVTYRFIKDFF